MKKLRLFLVVGTSILLMNATGCVKKIPLEPAKDGVSIEDGDKGIALGNEAKVCGTEKIDMSLDSWVASKKARLLNSTQNELTRIDQVVHNGKSFYAFSVSNSSCDASTNVFKCSGLPLGLVTDCIDLPSNPSTNAASNVLENGTALNLYKL